MSLEGLSQELQHALEQLVAPEPLPACFEEVARWRRACGDAEAAATWQTWSILPPEPAELQQALAHVWSGLGDTQRASALLETSREQPGWLQLTVLLQESDLTQAAVLQQKLLQDPPPLPVPDLLELVQQWQQAEVPAQALALLERLVGWMEQRGEPVSGQLCSAMADLLEQQHRFDQAEPWWQRSHALQPHLAWPLMRLGHQALRRQQPLVAVHYASQVLQRDPAHTFAPRLQRKALEAVAADRSLALLDGERPTAPPALPCPPEGHVLQGCRCLALVGFSEVSILEGWPAANPADPCQLFLIASPDPLWTQHQATALLESAMYCITIESWPVWDPQRHGSADRVLEALPEPPGWRLIPQGG